MGRVVSSPGKDRERRSWTSGLDPVTVGVTWVLFLFAFPFLESQEVGLETLVGGGLIGLPLVVFGFLAASRCRTVSDKDNARRAKLAILALLAGTGVGAANLGANVALAAADASIRAGLHEHLFAKPLPWERVVSVAVVEEIAFRLFLMSVVAWIAARFLNKARTVFLTALFVSAFLFAVPHLLGRSLPTHSAIPALYASGVVVKSGVAGVVLGWIFWRWGLPYAIVCHFAANGLHKVFEPMLFS